MSYIVEKDWITSVGLRAVAIIGRGHRCGYVGVPVTHPLYGVGYNQPCPHLRTSWEHVVEEPIGDRGIIPLFLLSLRDAEREPTPDVVFNVHGSITYSGGGDGYPVDGDEWWFGFDCGHHGDAVLLEAMPENTRRIFQRYGNPGVVRDLPFVIDECEKLAVQLVEVSNA
jgi:hypothetical protein